MSDIAIQAQWKERTLRANGITWDLSIPFDAKGGASAWYVEPIRIDPVMSNGFIGSVALGGAVNFKDVTFNPHGNGTHTECCGHITLDAESVNRVNIPMLMVCVVVSVSPSPIGEDSVITLGELKRACETSLGGAKIDLSLPEALVLRTAPNATSKRSQNWSNTNPPYLEPEATAWLADQGVLHLLLDLPSVDREEDGGTLLAHHAFWRIPDSPRHDATITEFIFVPNSIENGLHLLNLQTAPFELDATPSRPLLLCCEQAT